jgi:hypothetical protein
MISKRQSNGSVIMQTATAAKDDWGTRHRRSMKPRDAIIDFQCSAPNFVEVNETINGENIHSQRTQQHPDVVTKMEGKYIFFADEAEMARKMVSRGHSCVVSVYLREP